MLHHLLSDLVESGILGQIGDITVHLAIHLYILHYLLTVSLQTTIEVMQVLDTADLPCRGIEEFGGDGLGYRIVALLLVSGYQIITFNSNHIIECRDFIGRVLQIGIHGDDNITLCLFEAAIQGRTLTVVSSETDAFYLLVLFAKLTDYLPRLVCTAVVDKDHLITIMMLVHHTGNPFIQFGNRLFLIK